MGYLPLTLNAEKCATIRTDVDRKSKIWCCNPNDFLVSRNGKLVKALNIIEGYQYLGNTVKVGRASETPLDALKVGVSRLSKAPLKPQQRMFILRTNLIRSLLHKAVLGRMSRGTLVYMDRVSRAAVRGWLRLPRDTPVAFFHAESRDGGLAVHILRYIIPILRRKRMSRMFTSEDSVVRSVTELPVYQRDIGRCSAPLSAFGQVIRNGETIRKAMANGLYRSVDGTGLRGCSD